MNLSLSQPSADVDRQTLWLLLPILAGFALLFLPTYWRLSQNTWHDEAHAHGPFVLMIVAWLIYRQWPALRATIGGFAPVSGGLLLAAGLLCYVLGRSQGLILLEVGAQLPVLVGLVLLMAGWQGVRVMWFPLLFLVFMVPLPGFLIDAITGPLKSQVSALVEWVLYGLGLPISRNGVILNIGHYQLQVADACSGLNSMYSLSAMGLLFLNLMNYQSKLRTALVIASILPIAFAANVIRVMTLVLVTYYLGDDAGHAFHDIAAISLYIIALLLLFGFDAMLRPLFMAKKTAP